MYRKIVRFNIQHFSMTSAGALCLYLTIPGANTEVPNVHGEADEGAHLLDMFGFEFVFQICYYDVLNNYMDSHWPYLTATNRQRCIMR